MELMWAIYWIEALNKPTLEKSGDAKEGGE